MTEASPQPSEQVTDLVPATPEENLLALLGGYTGETGLEDLPRIIKRTFLQLPQANAQQDGYSQHAGSILAGDPAYPENIWYKKGDDALLFVPVFMRQCLTARMPYTANKKDENGNRINIVASTYDVYDETSELVQIVTSTRDRKKWTLTFDGEVCKVNYEYIVAAFFPGRADAGEKFLAFFRCKGLSAAAATDILDGMAFRRIKGKQVPMYLSQFGLKTQLKDSPYGKFWAFVVTTPPKDQLIPPQQYWQTLTDAFHGEKERVAELAAQADEADCEELAANEDALIDVSAEAMP